MTALDRFRPLAPWLLIAGCGAAPQPARRPNILLVTLDTLRADRVGCYGYEEATTPTLDALAARGVLFEQAYTPAPMTLPAHSTLMTGLLPPQHGARVNGLHQLPEDVPTLAESLNQAGYRTGAFIAAYVLDSKFGLDRGFEVYDDDLSSAYAQEVPEELSKYRPGDQVVDSALAWLREGPSSQPFFAWVHLYDVHYPWQPHGKGDDPAQENVGTYDGEVAFADAQVGRLIAYLEQEGRLDETIVVAVADHGEGLGDHHEIEHAYLLNEEVLHVPWIMAGPGIRAGHRASALVTLADLQPTLMERVDLADTGAEGRSLAAALAGEPMDSGVSYAETDLPWTSFRWAPQRSLTTDRWKYIRTKQSELYDREADRSEYANLVEARAEVREDMEARLSALEERVGDRSSDVTALGREELQRLEALGYAAGSSQELPEDTGALADMKERLHVKDLATELNRLSADEEFPVERRVAMARQLTQASPETPAFHARLGQALIDAGRYADALPSLETAVELAPTDAGLHYTLGDTLQQTGQTARAREHIEVALDLAPEMASAHVTMGNIQRSEGRTDLAAGEYSEALRLRPEYPEAYFNLAQSFRDRQLVDKAVESMERALECRPGWVLAMTELAGLYEGRGEWERAAETLRAAVAERPQDPDLRNRAALLLAHVGRIDAAREQFRVALELAPASPLLHLNVANLAFDLGDDPVASRHYEEALRLAPDAPDPQARLARFLAITSTPELRDAARAVSLAERAVTEAGRGNAPPLYLDTLAAAYAALGRFEDALLAAERARERALESGLEPLAQGIAARRELYEAGKPFVAPVPAGQATDLPPNGSSVPEENRTSEPPERN